MDDSDPTPHQPGSGSGSDASASDGTATPRHPIQQAADDAREMVADSLAAMDDWVPSMRGMVHLIGAVIFAGLGTWLVVDSIEAGTTLVALVYAVSVVAGLTVSALYHRVGRRGRFHRFWRRLDHSMILVWISASYTPVLVLAVASGLSWVLLTLVWGLSVIGIATYFIVPTPPRWFRVGLPLGLGWVALVVLPDLSRSVQWWMLGLIALGGVLYSIGALLYFYRWPNPLPRHFGFHEVFHLLVLAAAACHFAALYPLITRGTA